MEKSLIALTALLPAAAASADIFTDIAKIEAFDKIDANECVSGIYYAGEKNPRFELSPKLRAMSDELRIRSEYPDAWRMYARGEVEDFSYFGFKLWQMESGRIAREEFFGELQNYISKNFKY
ncbi:MAG: hypothetical protein J6P03_06650 [Opitutales bacterium]|nr:hypothetical protein [Opitutales bacterium]